MEKEKALTCHEFYAHLVERLSYLLATSWLSTSEKNFASYSFVFPAVSLFLALILNL
jgi:hypothetical protein